MSIGGVVLRSFKVSPFSQCMSATALKLQMPWAEIATLLGDEVADPDEGSLILLNRANGAQDPQNLFFSSRTLHHHST